MSLHQFRFARRLFGISLAPLLLSGCNDVTVRGFAGAVIELDLEGVPATAPGEHLEVWARDRYDDVVRISVLYDAAAGLASYGLDVRSAIDAGDPCMIDERGQLLTTAAAYAPASGAGITQTADEQAAQVRNRIAQLTAPPAGIEPTSLLAVVPADDPATVARPDRDADPAVRAATRLADCRAYWAASAFAYTANPAQVTAPIHSVAYGFIAYSTLTPPASYSGVRLDTPVALVGIRELWLTTEGSQVDPLNRGPILLDGTPDAGGRGVVHFTLVSQRSGIAGSAAVVVDFSDDNATF
jgi:hypothetical protein